MQFVVGKRVRHKYTKEDLWVLRKGNEQVLCRTRDLREIWFYEYELEEVEDELVENRGSRFL